MPGFRKVIISRPPPSGYSWQVLKGTELVRAGNAGSHAEADAAADRAIAEIEAEASPDATGISRVTALVGARSKAAPAPREEGLLPPATQTVSPPAEPSNQSEFESFESRWRSLGMRR
jgi:hypothetical protein